MYQNRINKIQYDIEIVSFRLQIETLIRIEILNFDINKLQRC